MFDMFHSCITRAWFSHEAVAHWDDAATIQAWIDTELALAEAQGELGMIPADVHERMRAVVSVEKFDLDALADDISRTMHPLVPFLRQFEAMCPDDIAGYLHWGITTQNVFETGASLQLKKTHAKIVGDLDRAIANLLRLARQHASTVQAGRTHGQHALPITFGYRVAGWAIELRRQQARLSQASVDALVAHFGGGVGAFGAMQGRGRAVQDRAAALLGLSPTRIASRSNFDGTASYFSATGVLAGLIEKMAAEIAFLQRTEIAEVHEHFEYGVVGSSTMAQKRNPARCNNLIGVARLLKARVPIILDSLVRLNDADAASSNVADVTVPEMAVMAASLAEKFADVVSGLVVDSDRMKANFDLTNGLIMSEPIMMDLAPLIGRGAAHHVLYDAVAAVIDCKENFGEAIASHAKVKESQANIDIDRLLDPSHYLAEIIDWVEKETVELAGDTEGTR